MRRAGLTLVEIMVAVTIFSIMAAMGLMLVVSALRGAEDEGVPARLNAECRRILDQVARDLVATNASMISPPAPLQSPVLELRRAQRFDVQTGLVVYAPAPVRWALEPDRAGWAIVRYEDAANRASRRVLSRNALENGLAFTWDAGSNNMFVEFTLRLQDRRGRWVTQSRRVVVQMRNRN